MVKNFMSLSQDEILGFGDEFVNVNVTKLKRYFYYLIVSFGYILNGFFVGWSSKFFSFDEELSDSSYFNRSQISWIISMFPLGVVLVSILLYHFYYWIGTKFSLLSASLLILLSWMLTVPYGNQFEILICARIMAGLGSGIIFILVPVYMKELMGAKYNGNIVDLLITQFGLGIFSQYFIDFITPMQLSAVIAILLSAFFFFICCLIPESPRYQAYCDSLFKNTYEFERAVKLHNLWSEEDLQRKSIVDLFDELKKLNLLSLIGLFLAEQFIGGISILFYMKHFATLSGQFSSEFVAMAVGLTMILSIPISKLIGFSKIQSTKNQIMISTIAIVAFMTLLGALCVVEGSIGKRLNFIGHDYVPLVVFVTVTFFYVVGISRSSLLIVQQILSSYSLQLHLRTLSIAVTWFVIFAITKLLPQLLYLVGVGYFYCYMVILTLPAMIFLYKIIPSSLNLEVDKATPSVMETSLVVSSASSDTPSVNPLSTCSSLNEVHQVENI